MAFLQCELIKLCLVSSAQGESPALPKSRAKLLLSALGYKQALICQWNQQFKVVI